ncbi:MAG: DinB family protein [Polaribacter sp.]|uniref:DinB family protein n=1 Tax=Polaribacter sp. TaxID=1920175 RepID=UPI003BAE357A
MIPKNEYAPYYALYINQIEKLEKTIVENLINSQKEFEKVLKTIPLEKQNYAYAAGKWTLKQVIQHIIDTERVFSYRALCFARNDKTSLPGFDQDFFVANDNSQERNFEDLLEEMAILRKSTILLYKSFSEEALLRIGNASNNNMSVRALGYLFSGHQIHHLNVIKERYL